MTQEQKSRLVDTQEVINLLEKLASIIQSAGNYDHEKGMRIAAREIKRLSEDFREHLTWM